MNQKTGIMCVSIPTGVCEAKTASLKTPKTILSSDLVSSYTATNAPARALTQKCGTVRGQIKCDRQNLI